MVEKGGAYRRRLRRDVTPPVEHPTLAEPAWWVWVNPVTGAQVVRMSMSVHTTDIGGPHAEIAMTPNETAQLPSGVWEHKVTVTDPVDGLTVLLRGTVRVRDTL